MRLDIAGRATLDVLDTDPHVVQNVCAQLDPYSVSGDGDGSASVVLVPSTGDATLPLVDVHNPAGDGVTTASDGTNLYLVDDGRRCALPAFDDDGARQVGYEPGFRVSRLFRPVIRPLLQLAFLDHDAVAVHSASVDVDGAGIVVGGWSETGKTETALAFLERGGGFVSDKWTVAASDGTLACFPISVGIRRWVLPYVPRLRRALPRRARLQLAAAGAASVATAPVRGIRTGGRAAEVAVGAMRQAIALADRAALAPSEVAAAYAQPGGPASSKLTTMALLTTVRSDRIAAEEAEAAWAAKRLARSAAYERRPFFDLCQRSRFAFVTRGGATIAEVERREEAFLAELLANVRVVDVRAPFPTDPHRVADAIARWL